MRRTKDNIIAVRQRSITQADEAFARFMALTEQCLNGKTQCDNTLYKKCSPAELEQVALATLREVAPQTPFRPDEIKLISGFKFPDIQAERYYGVEVKTTKSDSWLSTGICSNIRDFFTSGGQVSQVGNVQLAHPVPQVIKRLYTCKGRIMELLRNPEESMVEDITEQWKTECSPIFYENCWFNMVQDTFNKNEELANINVRKLFEQWESE